MNANEAKAAYESTVVAFKASCDAVDLATKKLRAKKIGEADYVRAAEACHAAEAAMDAARIAWDEADEREEAAALVVVEAPSTQAGFGW
jgi:hypothetical protein